MPPATFAGTDVIASQLPQRADAGAQFEARRACARLRGSTASCKNRSEIG
jgi:hypothetical protein